MRQVVTKRSREAIFYRQGPDHAKETRLDTYQERLIKYVPTESLVAYIALYGVLYAVMGSDPAFVIPARWLIVAGIIGTPLYLWKYEHVEDWVQLLISTIAFCLWAAALGVIPLSNLPGYNQIAASVLLPIYTFGVPLIDGVPGA